MAAAYTALREDKIPFGEHHHKLFALCSLFFCSCSTSLLVVCLPTRNKCSSECVQKRCMTLNYFNSFCYPRFGALQRSAESRSWLPSALPLPVECSQQPVNQLPDGQATSEPTSVKTYIFILGPTSRTQDSYAECRVWEWHSSKLTTVSFSQGVSENYGSYVHLFWFPYLCCVNMLIRNKYLFLLNGFVCHEQLWVFSRGTHCLCTVSFTILCQVVCVISNTSHTCIRGDKKWDRKLVNQAVQCSAK